MDGVPAIYLGRIVSKENFRAFIYSPNQQEKLVNSWDEYEREIATGLWFADKADAISAGTKEESEKEDTKPRQKRAAKQDEFLPKD